MDQTRNIENIYPLSPMQQGMLFHSLMAPESGVYVEQLTAWLTGPLNVDAFRKAWQALVDRHSIFRTAFVWEGVEEPLQVVYRKLGLPVQVEDWRSLGPEEQERRVADFLDAERHSGFDLGKAPLLRVHLLRLGDEDYRFVWTFHHILLDGWSFPIVLKELFMLYEGFSRGMTPRLPPARPYADYIAWIKKQDRAQAETFWRNMLQGFTAPTPLVMARRADVTTEAATYDLQALDLSPETSNALRELARKYQLTLNTFVQGAWALLLSRYSGEQDVVFGATVSGRPPTLPGSERMVGIFINTLPVRTRIYDDTRTFIWLQQLQALQAEMRQFEYSSLVDVQGWSCVSRDQALFESIIVFENYPVDQAMAQQRSTLQISDVHSAEQTNYPLTVVAAPGQVIGIRIAYDTRQFEPETIRRMLGHLQTILDAMARDIEQPVGALPLLTPAEERQILVEWNDTARPLPPEGDLTALFEKQVAATPDAIALWFRGETLPYAGLNARANQLAHALIEQGVGAGDVVGVYMHKSFDPIIALLGILKAGAAYLPLDPALPDERIHFMLEDSGAKMVISNQSSVNSIQSGELLTDNWLLMTDYFKDTFSTTNPDIHPVPEDPAYLIYTSGTTGRPKGVVIPRRAITNHAVALADEMALTPEDRILQFITLSFDAAGEEIYPALIRGAGVVIPESNVDILGEKLVRLAEESGVTVLHMPASVWNVLVDELDEASAPLWPGLRLLLLGGDAPDVERLHKFTRLLGRSIPFVNLYGPTETTITATRYHTTTDVETSAPLPIGSPIANVQAYVLDEKQRLLPAGAPGELHIGGLGLALGYHNLPEQTAEAFIHLGEVTWPAAGDEESDGHLPEVATRVYRTGDRARWTFDGQLIFLGRVDDQVKIRGFRVEPGEIEATLHAHPAVQDAAVVAETDDRGQKQLAAYLALTPGVSLEGADLREFLNQRLPFYMMPAHFTVIEELPRTPTGKLDRRALQKLAGERISLGAPYVAPRGPEEEMLAGIWSQVLGAPRVGVHDNFFELGGHSLLATQLASRVREAFGVDVPLSKLFECPTVAQLAEIIQQAREQQLGLAAPPIEPAPRDKPLPLSFAQLRLWFLDQLEPGNLFYNMPMAVRMVGRLDVDALDRALNEIIRRHEVLRTSFADEGGEPYQIIHPEMRLDAPIEDLSDLPEAEREVRAIELARAEVRKPFDLATGPLLRARLLRLGDEEHIAVLVLHHIVADAWSIGVFLGELAALYNAFVAAQSSPLPELPIQYADYAVWQRNWLQGEVLEKQLAYWREKLAGAPPLLELPTDHPRPAIQTANGATHNFHIPKELADALNRLSKQENVTLFMSLLAGYEILLARYSGMEDISVGSAIANRTRGETERLIGFFVNTLVLRTDLSGNPAFVDLLARVRETALGAYTHQDIPFEMLVDELQPERNLSHTPLFQVGFALQNTPLNAQELPDLRLEPLALDAGSAKYDITLTLTEGESGIVGSAEYNTDLFDASTIERMMRHYVRLLEGAAADPERPVFHLPMLTPEEASLILQDWNQTATPYVEATFHALFEEQVRVRPDAPAAIFGDQQLTYDQLNRKANQLARYLIEQGVEPEDIVGLSVLRSLDMVVGILGILKAGGAYLPIDSGYPPERIRYMIEDSGIELLLTDNFTDPLFRKMYPVKREDATGEDFALTFDVLRITGDDAYASYPDENPNLSLTPDNLAYVIYTSGSTGRPKGTLLSHRGLSNLADVHHREFEMAEGKRVLQFSPFSFDASVWETVMALRNGAALVLAPQETLASGPDLLHLMKDQRVTTVTLPPSLLAVLEPDDLPDLHTVVAAGEACTNEIVRKWAPGRHFFNAYGPTETTVCASMHRVDPEARYEVGPPIGKPISNFQLYVVDSYLNPQPIGVPGELLIGGVGLARGYLNRPDLTAERFIPNPFVRGTTKTGRAPSQGAGRLPEVKGGQRLYRTGDLVKYLPNGDIEFLGRIDHQVKVRGFRIELGEIEARLRQFPGLQDSIVIVREDAPGDKRIVAYFTPEPGVEADLNQLRSFMREALPEYMVPSFFVQLEAMPLTPSNKIDRKALPAPDASVLAPTREYIPPTTETEIKLAAIIAELLHIERVGLADNFFELGGHSLLATQFISRVRDLFDVEMPLRALFEHPTIGEFAMQLDIERAKGAKTAARPAIKRRDRSARRVKRSDLDPNRDNHS